MSELPVIPKVESLVWGPNTSKGIGGTHYKEGLTGVYVNRHIPRVLLLPHVW